MRSITTPFSQSRYYLLASSIGTLVSTINAIETLKVLFEVVLLVLINAVLYT